MHTTQGQAQADDSAHEWPHLSDWHRVLIIAVNFGSLVAAWLLLRVIWTPPTQQQMR